MKRYSENIKLKAKELYDIYKNYSTVGKLLGVSDESVRYWINGSLRERIKAANQNKKDKITQYNKTYYGNNKENELNRIHAYYIHNKQKINKQRIIYHKHRYNTDIDYKLKFSLRNRVWASIKKYKICKSQKTLELLGCNIEILKFHLECLFTEGMTWNNYGKWHIDHIKPCCSFDLSVPEQQKQCFHYTNLQPLWAEDNIKKGKNKAHRMDGL